MHLKLEFLNGCKRNGKGSRGSALRYFARPDRIDSPSRKGNEKKYVDKYFEITEMDLL